MSITTATALWFLPFVLPICIWVAWNDMKFMKIPNKAVIALMGIFLVVGLIALPWAEYPWRFVHFIAVLAIGFVANMARALGAGDAKFAAAMAPFIDLGDAPTFFYLLAAVLLAAFATHRIAGRIPAMRRATPDWESWERKDFPMGFALGGTLGIYLVLGAVIGS